ncbi:MAG: hypothetical protein D3923_03570 [Candidatus Electrothrix sp. AR3]|nr:hypothetical protein [Candidatus Electrothrix sp. AR3]
MDGVQFPLIGNSIIMAVVILVHVFVAFFAVGGSVLSVTAEWWGTKKQDDDYLRLARGLSKFLSDMMKINGVLGVAIVVLTIGLWSQFGAFLFSVQFWPFLAEGGIFLLLMIFSVIYHNTWDSASRGLHIFYGICTFLSSLAAGVMINGIWAFMLVPGKWIESQDRWDAFFTPILVESTTHLLLPCLINTVLLVFVWTYWKAKRAQGEEQRYLNKINKFTASIGGVILFLQPISGVLFLLKVKGATESLPAPNPWSQLWTAGGMARPFLFTMMGLATVAMICAIIYWIMGHVKGRRFLLISSLALFTTFFIGGFTRERARKPYLVWGTMYMNQQRVGAKNTSAASTDAPLNGEQVFLNHQCMSCHSFKGEGGSTGPDLTSLSGRYDKTKLMNFVRQPPEPANMSMPPFSGPENELEALVEYLLQD